jgi:multiple sugar transport system substrate-binding protein
MLNNVKTAGLNTRSFDFPVFSPDAKGNWTSSHNFTVPVKPNLDPERIVASLEFINWLGEHSETWSEAGHVPAHRGGQTDVFRNMPQAFLADQNEELKIFGYKYYGHAVEALDKVVGDIFFGKMDVDEGLRQAIQETKDRIAEGS